jgi:DNA-binding response OmpR family regulator
VNEKVLLVEDDSDYREVIHLNLELNGFEVFVAGDGEEAVEIAKRRSPDIVLMDLMLPVVGGLDATRRIKTEAATKRIPVVVFSALCWDIETKRKALGAGALECLNKPLDFDHLPALLAEHALNGASKRAKSTGPERKRKSNSF